MFNVVGVTRRYKRRDCASDTFFRSRMCTQLNVGSNIDLGGEGGSQPICHKRAILFFADTGIEKRKVSDTFP